MSRWPTATALVDRLFAVCLRLSFLQLAAALTLIAVVAAQIGSQGLWYWGYGVYGVPVITVTLGATLFVAIPMVLFLVFVISKLRQSWEALKRGEAELTMARDRAEGANRAKSAFLANMSHELRTPLNAIIGFSEMIDAEVLGPVGAPRYRNYAGDILASGRHLLGIVNDILDMAKVEDGSLSPGEDLIDIEVVVADALRMVRAGNPDVPIFVGEDQPHGKVRGSARLYRQVLLNLLSNATKFTPPGGHVMVRGRADEGRFVIIEIEDTGIGMSKDGIAIALTPFGQVDDSLGRRYEGTGLGLPLAKQFTELLGGTFAIHSALGAGTCVRLSFPLVVSETLSQRAA
jgi:two-component system, cell cycle sensor histidine kinase PleC